VPLPTFFGAHFLKPLCTLCDTRHEKHQAHVFATTKHVVNAVVNKHPPHVVNVPAPKPETRCVRADEPIVLESIIFQSRDRHRKTPERAAYMREYMRKRRAGLR
jgi:hypothetical protein